MLYQGEMKSKHYNYNHYCDNLHVSCYPNKSFLTKKEFEQKMSDNALEKENIFKQIQKKETEIIQLSNDDREKYLDKINYYLRYLLNFK